MKKNLLLCAALVGVAFNASAFAADGFYTRASAAWFQPVEDDIFEGDLGALVAVGQNFGAHSVEVETGFVELSESFGGGFELDLRLIPVTAGYQYNLPLGKKFTLGLGVNAGVAVTNLEAKGPGGSSDDDDTVLIASGLARLGYAVSDTLTVSAGYRYVVVDDLEYFGGLTLEDTDTHVVDLGVEVRW